MPILDPRSNTMKGWIPFVASAVLTAAIWHIGAWDHFFAPRIAAFIVNDETVLESVVCTDRVVLQYDDEGDFYLSRLSHALETFSIMLYYAATTLVSPFSVILMNLMSTSVCGTLNIVQDRTGVFFVSFDAANYTVMRVFVDFETIETKARAALDASPWVGAWQNATVAFVYVFFLVAIFETRDWYTWHKKAAEVNEIIFASHNCSGKTDREPKVTKND